MIVTAGKTNVTAYFYIIGDAGHATPGEPITGLLFSDIETGGSASYMRQGAARVDLTLKTIATAATAHDDGAFILVDDTNMPGVYRCDYPDLAFATGVDQVILQLVVASGQNAVVTPIMVDITDVDLRDSVRAGMTALPNAVVDGAGGLATSAGGATGIDDLATPTNITAGTITTVTNLTNAATSGDLTATMKTSVTTAATSSTPTAELSAAAVDLIWDETMAGHVTADTSGLLMNEWQDGGRLDVILDAIKVAADSTLVDTASMGIVKNAIFSDFMFPMVLTTDHYTAATSKTVTGAMSIDGAAFTATNGTIAEISAGVYQIDLTAADTNGDIITYKFSATACDDTIITVTTRA